MKLFLFIILIFVSYSIIPTLIYRKNSLKKIQPNKQNSIYLTFDDGPDPLYTPILLDLLKEFGVKATFFVVGERAKRYPDLILRMKQEGHTIGIHHYTHVSNWFLDPFSLHRHIAKTCQIIQEITGERPIYYRPPWGHFNLFSGIIAKTYKTIVWTYTPRDWNLMSPDELKHRIQTHLEPGMILLLHDNGDTFGANPLAPKVMIKALRQVLEEHHKQYTFSPINEGVSH